MDSSGTSSSQVIPVLQESLFSVLELFPMPMELFSPDGVSLFVNQAFMDFFQITESNKIAGRFNILSDPYMNHKLGLSDYLKRIFSGEILSVNNIRISCTDKNSRYSSSCGKPWENDVYQDINCFPLRDEKGLMTYVIALYISSGQYPSRLEVIKAKNYIDSHWHDDYNLESIAFAANMSPYHLSRLFKKYFGITAYQYYQELKIERIKTALQNTALSIGEAFASCGTDYSSGFLAAFKRKVGMTPSSYRKSLNFQANMKESDSALPSHYSEIQNRLFSIAELFPVPVQIFSPNGDILYINEAVLNMWNVRDTTSILGKYNLLNDSLVNKQFGLKDEIQRAFQGEIVLIPDIRLPLEHFWKSYYTRSDAYDIEAIYTNILNFPVRDSYGKMIFLTSVFFTSRIYQGAPEVAKAREFLENHWREKFNSHKLAEAAGIRHSYLVRLFKKHTGITPFHYYQNLKFNGIKADLRNSNLSIEEVFIACGFESPGNYTRFFKERAGMTPSAYRKTLGI